MKVAIIEYNSGNTCSVGFALERLGVQPVLTDDPEIIRSADKIIFPGVGEAGSAMKYLKEKKIDQLIRDLEQPVLGICLGMQLLCRNSEESNTICIGVFDQVVRRFEISAKVPHTGWNEIRKITGPLFKNMPASFFGYFVHGYYAGVCRETIAETDYEIAFSAALQKENFYGVQFHPEKSAKDGEQVIRNFLNL